MRSSQLSVSFSSKEVSCSALEALLHDGAVVVSIVFFTTESLFLNSVKVRESRSHGVAKGAHHVAPSVAETVPGCHNHVVFGELFVSVTGGPENGRVWNCGSCESSSIIVNDTSVISVDLNSFQTVLIGGGSSRIFVMIVHGFISYTAV